LPKDGREGDEVTKGGRSFHIRAAATENAWSPMVEQLVNGMLSSTVELGS